VTKQRWLGIAFFVVSCGAPGAAPVKPASSAAGAVRGFMQAVADSNLAGMSTLWGTSSGPAAKTGQPQDYQRRIVIMQAYLRNDSFKLLSDSPETTESRRDLQVEIKRQKCSWTVPFVAVRTGDGTWIVNQVDLTAAGNPARPCKEGETADSARHR
jgi:hypothetical protein